jgi:two-component system response regulator YesN
VCGTSTSALKARELLGQLSPDIIITDIRMPGLNGLDFTSIAMERYPDIQVIVVTGYGDFAYAQKALRLGAVDLLLKPLQDSELENALARAVERANRTESLSNRSRLIEARLQNTVAEARRKLLIDLIRGYCTEEKLARDRGLSVDYSLRRYRLLLGVDMEPESPVWRGTFYEMPWDELVADGARPALVPIGVIIDDAPVCVIAADSDTSDLEQRIALENTIRSMTQWPGWNGMHVAVSSAHAHLVSMKKAYEEACLAATTHFVSPGSRIVHFEDETGKSVFDELEYHAHLTSLTERMSAAGRTEEESDIQAVLSEMKAVFSDIRSARHLGLRHMEALIRSLFDSCGVPVRSSPQRPLWPDAPAFPYRSLDDCAADFESGLRRRLEVSADASTMADHHAKLMLNYLRTHYPEDVRLSHVAQALGLSPAYVSRIARRKTGRTFTELLAETRIRRAIELLQTTNAKVYQIADQVGISNYAYFYQVFRKFTNQSPNDFRD